MINKTEQTSCATVNECPACGSRDFSQAGSAPGLTCRLGVRDFVQPDYVIKICSACGLVYRNPNLSPEELGVYYSLVDYRKWEVPGFFPTERAAHKRLRQLPCGARLLDFGCSSGRLLAPLAGSYDCCGFEINTEAARIAAAKGLTMISPEDFESGNCDGFDAIVMSDVFEHLSAPTELLRKLVSLLNPGGELLIITGNADAPVCRLAPAEFWYFRNVEHLCMLSRRYAEFFCQKLDVTLAGWWEMSHYDTPPQEHLFQLVRHFAYWQFRRATLLSTVLLPLVPLLNRARRWPIAPAYTASADHVLAAFKKK
jgi:SAM-dependent methyltransferase